MKSATYSSIAAALLTTGLLATLPIAFSHGGTYRGPGDTVPPQAGGGDNGGGGDPFTPGGSNPDTPSPGIPGIPGTGNEVPGMPGVGQNPGTGITDMGPSLEGWSFWWEFNKDPYLNLKDAIRSGGPESGTGDWFLGRGQTSEGRDTLRPTQADITNKIVPALLYALENETNNDIVTGAMMALAKIGEEQDAYGESKFGDLVMGFLADNSQEISETAALALGILANDSSVSTLVDLLEDTTQGRLLVESNEVHFRTRSFAAYGLALVGSRTGDEAIRASIFRSLQSTLESDDTSTRDIKVACVISMGLVPMEKLGATAAEFEPGLEGAEPAITRAGQVDYLLEYFQEKRNQYNVRAHAPTAICRLLEGLDDDKAKEIAAEVFLDTLGSKTKNVIKQSCVLALGQLGDTDPEGIDSKIRKALMGVKKSVTDTQTRNFSTIALAQSGSRIGEQDPTKAIADVSKHLMVELTRGKNAVHTWAGLAMGVMGNSLGMETPADLIAALELALSEERTPRIGAYAIGAGILGSPEFTATLLDKLETISDDTARGYICVALGMLGAREAVIPISAIVKDSSYRPELLRQASIALGLLGDKGVVEDLILTLENSGSLSTQAALSSALGFIGDKRSIDPLVDLLTNEQVSKSARGFAAVALGMVADKEDLPWNSKIATNLNYRASTVSLNDQGGTGVLNIL